MFKTIFKAVFAIFMLIVLSSILIFSSKIFGGLNIEYSSGQRTGVPLKISRKGVYWKTWEGELSLQMMKAGENGRMVNMIFTYSVSSDSIAQIIESRAKSGDVVTLHYKEYFLRGFMYGETSYDIIAVE